MAAEKAPQAGPQRRPSKEARAPWQLVWLSEFAFRSQFAERRKAIFEATEAAGGSVVCLKTMARYTEHLGQESLIPFILVTGWREAKPCVKEIAAQPEAKRPLFMIVLPEAEQHLRAVRWAETVESEVPVHVIGDVQALSTSLDDAKELLGTAVGAQAPLSKQPTPPGSAPPTPSKGKKMFRKTWGRTKGPSAPPGLHMFGEGPPSMSFMEATDVAMANMMYSAYSSMYIEELSRILFGATMTPMPPSE